MKDNILELIEEKMKEEEFLSVFEKKILKKVLNNPNLKINDVDKSKKKQSVGLALKKAALKLFEELKEEKALSSIVKAREALKGKKYVYFYIKSFSPNACRIVLYWLKDVSTENRKVFTRAWHITNDRTFKTMTAPYSAVITEVNKNGLPLPIGEKPSIGITKIEMLLGVGHELNSTKERDRDRFIVSKREIIADKKMKFHKVYCLYQKKDKKLSIWELYVFLSSKAKEYIEHIGLKDVVKMERYIQKEKILFRCVHIIKQESEDGLKIYDSEECWRDEETSKRVVNIYKKIMNGGVR